MPHKILVADDDPLIRLAAGTWLEAAGYVVLACADASGAAALAASAAPALALVDVQLGDSDGVALAGELRRLGGVTVVLMSADAPPPGWPARFFMQKPLQREALLKITASLLPR